MTTMMLVAALFASGLLWSLFAKDLGVGNESFELSALVAPVLIPAEKPPVPEPIIKEARSENAVKETVEKTTRRENILQISESPIVPKDISTVPLVNKERPRGTFTISNGEELTATSSSPRGRGDDREGNERNVGISQNSGANLVEESSKEVPPPIIKKPNPMPKSPVTQSLGVINGKAINLPKPAYPAAAQAVRAGGDVSVQVTIDESGRVISARAINGHVLLRNVSETAARSAKFDPTLLSNTPVKVTGIIIYKFQMK